MAEKIRAAIFTNIDRDPDFSYTKKVVRTLLACEIGVCADRRFRYNLGECKDEVDYHTYVEEMLRAANMIVVLGGDGSILEISEKAATHGLPVLGINLGHLGFLTTLERDEVLKLTELARGNYTIDERMMASVRITDNSVSHEFYALNDITVTSVSRAKIGSFNVSCNEKTNINFKADGVVISTPTGSTAYSLSAGGPVIDTSTELFCMTPLCPHSLTSRPIVFSGDSVITVSGKTGGAVSDVFVTSDGRSGVQISENARITIRRSDCKMKLVRIGSDGFFDILSKKMYGI